MKLILSNIVLSISTIRNISLHLGRDSQVQKPFLKYSLINSSVSKKMSVTLEKNLSTAFLWRGRTRGAQEGDHIEWVSVTAGKQDGTTFSFSR